MKTKELRYLLRSLGAAGVELRFVGGCVRDTLAGLPVGDIDLATPALPKQVIAALNKARIGVARYGLKHGTVTALMPPYSFEITTLRRDVETDGRHAVVAFGADWEEDARRRDLTINALYLTPDGTLFDPVGGQADLAAHRVRFVGDPSTRIAEDVLRVLRYYRFEARFGAGEGDAAARGACRAALCKLSSLSAERVSRELMRLIGGPDPVRVLAMMRDDGVLAAILPEATRLDRLAALLPLATTDDTVVRLAGLVEVDHAGADAMASRLRLSAAEAKRLENLAKPWPVDPTAVDRAQRLALYRLGRERYRDLILLLAAEGRLKPAALRKLAELADTWELPIFPLGGRDVTALGIPRSPRVGELLDAVRDWWEQGDFAADRETCLAKLAELAQS